jgi:hypothetical protein
MSGNCWGGRMARSTLASALGRGAASGTCRIAVHGRGRLGRRGGGDEISRKSWLVPTLQSTGIRTFGSGGSGQNCRGPWCGGLRSFVLLGMVEVARVVAGCVRRTRVLSWRWVDGYLCAFAEVGGRGGLIPAPSREIALTRWLPSGFAPGARMLSTWGEGGCPPIPRVTETLNAPSTACPRPGLSPGGS